MAAKEAVVKEEVGDAVKVAAPVAAQVVAMELSTASRVAT